MRAVLRHEWRLLTSDASLRVVLVVIAIALAYGAFTGGRWMRAHEAGLERARTEERERLALHEGTMHRLAAGDRLDVSPFTDPRNPQVAASRSAPRYAILPPQPLGALGIGQADLLPASLKITSEAREQITGGSELEHPLRLLTGRFDVAFVIVYLFPLLVLALTYNVLSGEREQGTLALALSQPVTLRVWLGAKLVVRLAVVLAGVVALLLLALPLAGIDVTAPGTLARLTWLLVAMALYGAFWMALALLVASFGRPSATNAMVLAACWLVLVLLVPTLLNLLTRARHPLPSRVELVQAVREASEAATAEGSRLLARYYEDHPELATGGAEQAMNDVAMVRLAVAADVERRVRPLLDEFERRREAQHQLVARWRHASPALLLHDVITDLVGTGAARHRHFMTQVTAYHDAWRGYFVPRIARREQLHSYAELPRFTYRDESFAEVRARLWPALLGLVVPTILLAGVGLSRLRRVDVTG